MAKPLISPSLLSANFANLQADIQQKSIAVKPIGCILT